MFNEPMEFFEDAEPRLRAYVIFPGDRFKGTEIEVRGGIYTGSEPIQPLFGDYSYQSAETRYQHLEEYNGVPKTLYLSPREGNSQEIVDYNGTSMTAAGENGPFYDNGEGSLTGLYGRKWLNPDPSFEAGGKIRPALYPNEVCRGAIDAAEAAVELSLVVQHRPMALT